MSDLNRERLAEGISDIADGLIRYEKRVERLREALESIAEGVWPYGTGAGTVILEMRARAQNALAADNPQAASE